ncbi:MAG: hypothetical protein PHX30_05110 [Candidatus Pacebacteria bacterium]|jgi:hypothetical protein|nr:hypothetical protein [Candidatus Paceibacterota bacterium]
MKQPKIILKFDQKLEQELAWNFYNYPEFGGCNFWEERALKHHPELLEIKSVNDPKEFLDKYISKYYSVHSDEIHDLGKKTEEYLWQEENNFFLTVNKIFKGHPWTREEFTGDFSIFDFCPRFLEDGEFQVFIYDTRNLQLFTIFHEMLHFIFYDFMRKKFPENLGKMNTEEGKLWDLAEVFNAVIQDTDDFIKLHGKIENIGYPDHRELISKGDLLWKNNPDLYQWISKMTIP